MQNTVFNEKWLTAFGKSLTDEQKEAHAIGRDGGFLWHAFSFGHVPSLEGDEARIAYNLADKDGAKMCFYENTESPSHDKRHVTHQYVIGPEMRITKDYLTAEQIDDAQNIEVYIIGRGYKWCYIRTHEENCGPYFCIAQK